MVAFGTGKVEDTVLCDAVQKVFDLSPAAIIRELDLKRPIYERTAYHGHFGRDEFPWESTSKASALSEAVAAHAG